jgi:predicted amidohydrolase
MERLAEEAAKSGARWIMFHELTVCDYANQPDGLAELVPQGVSTTRMSKVAARLGVTLTFGNAEKDRGRIYDSQVFVGPRGYFYHYRKTWLWYAPKDESYRNEWSRYDPGTGPGIFTVDGVRATCFICADGDSARCIERAAPLRPQVVFFPNNRERLPPFEEFGKIARTIGAPLLATNRVGRSESFAIRESSGMRENLMPSPTVRWNTALFPALIADWRRAWDQGPFPFLFVQLANYQRAKKNRNRLKHLGGVAGSAEDGGLCAQYGNGCGHRHRPSA